MYGFGDASGGGFGASWEEKNGDIKYRAGTWGKAGSSESSNWRELKNLVDSLKEMAKEGKLVGVEAFIFTDNSTAENAFFKGTSSSPKLFNLLLELRELEMSSRCKIHIVHVAGTRMIDQGTDGLSRGNFTEGSMKGRSILDFIPLGTSAFDRTDVLKPWLESWTSDLEYLDPIGWFERGHDLVSGGDRNCEGHWIPKYKSGNFVWSPPPAAAQAAVEELQKARHKRQDSTHLFVVPRLLKPYWHKQLCLGNSSEPQSFWDWQASWRKCGKPTKSPKDLFCSNFGASQGGWNVCRRSWHPKCYKACPDTQFAIDRRENDLGMIWTTKEDEDRFLCARNGDLLGTPFQCDFCWFFNLKGRDPQRHSHNDSRLLSYIRRVNLDLFWCREPSTVAGTMRNLRKAKKMSESLGLDPVPLLLGPWPIADNQGFQVALEMVRASQMPGKNVSTSQQFDTIRKIRTAYTNAYEQCPSNALGNITFRPLQGSAVYFSNSPLTSVFFRRFIMGLERRMGRLVIQDLALDVCILLIMLEMMETEIRDRNTRDDKRRDLIICGAAFVALFAGALRGPEVFLAEGMEFCKRIDDGKFDTRISHVFFPLMGRFKMENGERNALFAFASETKNSKIRVRFWLEELAALLKFEGKDQRIGPGICELDGSVFPSWKMNFIFKDLLARIQQERNDLIPEDLDVWERYSIFRSFRRGATTRARVMDVPDKAIELNNRWRKFQNNRGSLPKLSMIALYTEINQALLLRTLFSHLL